MVGKLLEITMCQASLDYSWMHNNYWNRDGRWVVGLEGVDVLGSHHHSTLGPGIA